MDAGGMASQESSNCMSWGCGLQDAQGSSWKRRPQNFPTLPTLSESEARRVERRRGCVEVTPVKRSLQFLLFPSRVVSHTKPTWKMSNMALSINLQVIKNGLINLKIYTPKPAILLAS